MMVFFYLFLKLINFRLHTELSALHININTVHDTLGIMCRECERPPETKPSVNCHLLYVSNENQVCITIGL